MFVYVDDDKERAYRDFEAPCMWYFKNFSKLIPADQFPVSESYYKSLSQTMSASTSFYDRGDTTFQWMVEQSPFSHAFLVGDVETVTAKLKRLLNDYVGITDVLCWTRLGGLAHSKVMRSMDLLVNKVIPNVRDKAA